jgi:hypothetical protein
MRNLALAVGMSLLLSPRWAVFCQSQPRSPEEAIRAVAYVVPQPGEGEQDLSFQAVLFTAMRIELERAGLEVRVLDEAELASLAGAAQEALLERARSADTDFLIVERYTRVAQNLKVEIAAYGVEEADLMSSVTVSGRIGLRLDEAVTRGASELLPALETGIASAVQRRREALASRPPVEVALAEQAQPAGGPQAGPLPPAPVEPAVPEAAPAAEPATSEAAGPQTPLPIRPPTPAEAVPQRAPGWEAAAGAASFFPMLALSGVVKLGILSTFYLERLLSTSIGTLGLGLYAGYAGFLPADPNLAVYFQSLIPLGLDLRWTAFERSRLALFVRLLGGAALNVSDQSKVSGRLTRVLPQLKGGAGLSISVSRRIGISVEFLYEVLFYLYLTNGGVANDLIMGFNAPSICVYTKW